MHAIYSFQSIVIELKKSSRLTIPLMGTQFFYASNGIVTTMMLVRLGYRELATNALVWGIYISLIAISFGILNAVSVLVSHSYGIDDDSGVCKAVNQGIILAFMLTIPMIFIIWISPKILYLTNQEPGLIELAIPYSRSLMWCMLPVNLLMVLEQFLIGVSNTRLVLFLSLFRVPLEILLFYSLLFGRWGMPRLGIVGIGYGMTLSIVLSVVIILGYLLFSNKMNSYHIVAGFFRFNQKYFFELVRVGWPIGGMYFIEMSLFAAIALMIGQFGRVILVAHQIAYQCLVFTLDIIFAVAQGTAVRIGHKIGFDTKDDLRLSLYANIGIGLFFTFIIIVVYIYFPKNIIKLGIDVNLPENQGIIRYIVRFLLLAGLLQMTECFRLIISGGLRALKDTKVTMYITLVTFWSALPIGYLIAFVLDFGAIGIWLGLIVSLVVGAVVLWLRFRYVMKYVNLSNLITK